MTRLAVTALRRSLKSFCNAAFKPSTSYLLCTIRTLAACSGADTLHLEAYMMRFLLFLYENDWKVASYRPSIIPIPALRSEEHRRFSKDSKTDAPISYPIAGGAGGSRL